MGSGTYIVLVRDETGEREELVNVHFEETVVDPSRDRLQAAKKRAEAAVEFEVAESKVQLKRGGSGANPDG
ncbi:MAG: hypothetical protein ABEH65_07225 [Halobacteriales archaeon]